MAKSKSVKSSSARPVAARRVRSMGAWCSAMSMALSWVPAAEVVAATQAQAQSVQVAQANPCSANPCGVQKRRRRSDDGNPCSAGPNDGKRRKPSEESKFLPS